MAFLSLYIHKHRSVIFSLALLMIGLHAQAQTTNHPTIDTVDVSYMGAANNQVIPEVIIHLKTVEGISKVYCKIVNPTDSNTVYTVNYDINNLPISNSSGQVLCLKINTIIQIVGTTPVDLQSYIYQVQTEDNQGNKSINYILTRELEP